jgi:transposase
MPNPYPTALRERAVRTYEAGTETYAEVAARFSIHLNTLVRWVQRARDRGTVLPAPRGGGWYSPVDLPVLHALIDERPDRTTDELTRAYNQRAAPEARVHRSSILRALQRTGYVFKETAPTGGARSCPRPGRAPRLLAVDSRRRSAAPRVCR